MNFIDELFELYKDKLVNGEEEDIDLLAFAVLEQLNRDDLLNVIKEMDNQELYHFMGMYITNSLKKRFANEAHNAIPKLLH